MLAAYFVDGFGKRFRASEKKKKNAEQMQPEQWKEWLRVKTTTNLH